MHSIVYNTTDLRVEVRHDPYNWVVVFGNPNLKNFEKHAEYWYFGKLEAMLQRLFTLLRDNKVEAFNLDSIQEANTLAAKMITHIASALEERLADSHKEEENEKTTDVN